MSYLQVPSFLNSAVHFELGVLNESPPLLGSPYSCGVWSPLRSQRLSPSTLSVSSCESRPSVTGPLSYASDLKGIQDDMLLKVLYSFQELQYRVDVLLVDAQKMRMEVASMSRDFKKLTSNVDRKFKELVKTRLDLADQTYLDQLICLLNGDLRHLPINKWPFRLTRTGNEPINLVI